MLKASEIKKGTVVQVDGAPHLVRQVEARSPSSRGAATLYRIRFSNLLTGQKLEQSLKGDELLQESDCQRVTLQFSYQDEDLYWFMNDTDFSQYPMAAEQLEGQREYITSGLEGIIGLLMGERLVAIELPQSVVMQVEETAPGIRGSTASGRTKPARLVTGLEVQVPEYLESGEFIRVNTVTGKFMAREQSGA